MKFLIRNTLKSDYDNIAKLCLETYPQSPPWTRAQIDSHVDLFPEGQFIAEEASTGRLVGMSASLIISWDDYDFSSSWREFTDSGKFTNHDPEHGLTLYGAEVMVDPAFQGHGIGKKLYARREMLVRDLNLLRIRAGARLRGYATYAKEMTAEEYTMQVIRGKIFDPTLSFQLKQGFNVLTVTSDYLLHDSESLGYAAVIEWINDLIAEPNDYMRGEAKFRFESPWALRRK